MSATISFFLFLTIMLILTMAVSLVANHRRRKTVVDFELTPNILLTRYPIVFIPGEQSLFYFGQYWNQIPSYLAEHGFQVFKLNPPWKGQRREQFILSWLKMQTNSHEKFHIFCDKKTVTFLRTWSADFQNVMVSIQTPEIIKDTRAPDFSLWRIILKFHQLQTQTQNNLQQLGFVSTNIRNQLSPLLTQVRFLAEKDFSS